MIKRLSALLLMLTATMQAFSQSPEEQESWNVPQGWSYVLNVGQPEIYQFGTSTEAGKTMEIYTHRNAGILARDVSLANDDDVTISWDWQVDTLPSEVTEERNLKADYARYIGGEMPSSITQVWLISNSFFQGGVGKARVANISIGSDKRREKVL